MQIRSLICALSLFISLVVSMPLAAFAVSALNAAARIEAPAPPMPGAFTVQTAEYKFPATIDKDVLTTHATELWARAFWPTDLSKPHPIVFLLHGNHSTCGQGDPRIDSDCSYTLEGTCPVGQVVTPNHEGFNYLAQQLASLGYIAVTINANRGITCGASNSADWGLNLARGRLVLRHIEEWMHWATAGGAPTSLGISPDAFLGKVDFTNVGLMGHSRGGEGMRAVLAQYRDAQSIWPARIPNLKIRGIFEIGSVDGQAGRILDADDTAWNQLIPMCDGDVTDLQGRLPFERMLKKTNETRKSPKSLTMVYGTNHNFFNSEWKTEDPGQCFEHKEIHGTGPESTSQQTVAAAELSAFMLANVGAEKQPEMGRFFDPNYLLPSSMTAITRVDRDHLYTFDRLFSQVVDDFDQPTGTSSGHKQNIVSNVQMKNALLETPTRAEVSWTSPGLDRFVQLNWTDKGQGRDLSTFTSLDFRIGRPMEEVKEKATEFSLQLIDAKNRGSQLVSATKYVDMTGPGNAVDLYQTVRIPLTDFALAAGAKIRGVRLIFNQTPNGHLNVANVRFASNNPAVFSASADKPLLPQTIILIPKDENDESDTLNTTKTTAIPDGNNQAVVSKTAATDSTSTSVTQVVSSAIVIQTKNVSSSKYLSGGRALEITVGSLSGSFPVESEIPTLVMNGNRFSVSRYPPTGKINMLTFSLPREDFDKLPLTGAMTVQYGRNNPRKIWNMRRYNRSELSH